MNVEELKRILGLVLSRGEKLIECLEEDSDEFMDLHRLRKAALHNFHAHPEAQRYIEYNREDYVDTLQMIIEQDAQIAFLAQSSQERAVKQLSNVQGSIKKMKGYRVGSSNYSRTVHRSV